jgi:PiT family inorganic phosphate transporter
MAELSGLLLVVVILALLFDFSNGWHDSANAIATVVSTRVVSPSTAVLVAGVLNVAGAFMSTAVAKMVGTGIVDPQSVTQAVVASALAGAIVWNFVTLLLGLSDQLFSCADRGAGRCCVDPRRHGGRQVLGSALGA